MQGCACPQELCSMKMPFTRVERILFVGRLNYSDTTMKRKSLSQTHTELALREFVWNTSNYLKSLEEEWFDEVRFNFRLQT